MVSLWYLYGNYIGGRAEELRIIIRLSDHKKPLIAQRACYRSL